MDSFSSTIPPVYTSTPTRSLLPSSSELEDSLAASSSLGISFQFEKQPGPLLNDESDDPCDFFDTILGSKTYDYIADQTNLYASQQQQSSSTSTTSPSSEWEEVSRDEMRAFLGILITMGVHRLPSLADYWSTHPLLGAPGITKGMSRDRSKYILKNLHLNDNSNMQEEKLILISSTKLGLCYIRLSSTAYQLHQQMAVDEAMVLFKGRSSIKQYMPLKPIKRGYKFGASVTPPMVSFTILKFIWVLWMEIQAKGWVKKLSICSVSQSLRKTIHRIYNIRTQPPYSLVTQDEVRRHSDVRPNGMCNKLQ